MKTLKLLGLTAIAALTVGVTTTAEAHKKMDTVTRYDVMTNDTLRKNLSKQDIVELHQYFDHLHREPCQEYKNPPAGFVYKDCELWFHDYKKDVAVKDEIHFDFNSAELSRHEKSKVSRLARKIKRSGAKKVTVSGHADTVGNAEYNQMLSHKRAKAVAMELKKHGVDARVTKKAYGEHKLAVKTGDGVKSHANRRVEVMFKQ